MAEQTKGFVMTSDESTLHGHINKVCKRMSNKQPSIFRVPDHLKELNNNAYTPCHISIGPFRHRDDKYSVMEEHKLVYTKDLILRRRWARTGCRASKDVTDDEVNEYIKLLSGTKARDSYAETINLKEDEFVKMLLIDGCFIVEFLCKKIRKLSCLETAERLNHGRIDEPEGIIARILAYFQRNPTDTEQRTMIKYNNEARNTFNDMYVFIDQLYEEWYPGNNDFIFQSTRTSFEVRRDLTLLENQLPYFILEDIYNFTFSDDVIREFNIRRNEELGSIIKRPPFSHIVYCSLRTSIPNNTHVLTRQALDYCIIENSETNAHFVSFLRMCCGPNNEEERRENMLREFPNLCYMETPHEIRVPSATRLAKAGILFEKTSSETPLLKIEFDAERGVLKMPALTMWHHTEIFYRNVMAHELYNHTVKSGSRTISDYMCFMDDLINSKEDVALLVKSGIIQNWLESDQVVADVFNSITKHVLADYSSYSKPCEQLNNYRQKYNMRRMKAILRQDYFSQPWAIIYFITFVLIQTTTSLIQSITSLDSKK